MSISPKDQWTAVDAFIDAHLVGSDDALTSALEASLAAGLPAISVSPSQGKLLHLLIRLQQARTALEIGTLGAYSTIWMARGLIPGGRMVTLEAVPKHAEVARENLQRAGLSATVDVRLGPALQTLPQLAKEGIAPFDFIFIDADKQSTADYFEWAVRLSRPGTLVVVDNVVRGGGVIDAASQDPGILGMRRFYELLEGDPRVSGTAIQTVGSKGYDGFAMALVLQPVPRS